MWAVTHMLVVSSTKVCLNKKVEKLVELFEKRLKKLKKPKIKFSSFSAKQELSSESTLVSFLTTMFSAVVQNISKNPCGNF